MIRRRRDRFTLRTPPWDYQPRGPFTMHAYSRHGHWTWTSSHLDELLDIFSTMWLPTIDGENCGIHDRDGNLVVCFTTDAGAQFWTGCAAGFEALSRIHRDPLAVVLYEAMARGDFADLEEQADDHQRR